MKRALVRLTVFCILSCPIAPCQLIGSVTIDQADYDRAATCAPDTRVSLSTYQTGRWIGDTARFWYRKTLKDGYQFVLWMRRLW
jgi:hypothetical protein